MNSLAVEQHMGVLFVVVETTEAFVAVKTKIIRYADKT
jgi:hypothetical protein